MARSWCERIAGEREGVYTSLKRRQSRRGSLFLWSGNRPLFFCSEVVGGVAEEPVVEVGDGAEKDGGLMGGELGSGMGNGGRGGWGTGDLIRPDLRSAHLPHRGKAFGVRSEKVAGLEYRGEAVALGGVAVGAGFYDFYGVGVVYVVVADVGKFVFRCLLTRFGVQFGIDVDVRKIVFIIFDHAVETFGHVHDANDVFAFEFRGYLYHRRHLPWSQIEQNL